MNAAELLGIQRAADEDWLRLRFWPRVSRTPSCWLWTGTLNAGGYGDIHLGVIDGRKIGWKTHRLSWLVAGWTLESGKELDHLCRVRHCCNPDHLELVDHAVNVARGLAGHHNAVKTHCAKGHPYSPENTYRPPRGTRECRTCIRARWKTFTEVAP